MLIYTLTSSTPVLLLISVIHLIPLTRLYHLPEDIQSTNQLAIQYDLGESCT